MAFSIWSISLMTLLQQGASTAMNASIISDCWKTF